MKPITRKVFAYITHGQRLLLFRQPESPAAGIQVPAGTVEPGEDLVTAVLREAFEESGLEQLQLVGFLGDCFFDYAPWKRNQIAHRHFYHLRYEGDAAETWVHYEEHPSEGEHRSIPFEFFWAELPNHLPPLTPGHDHMIPTLLESLGIDPILDHPISDASISDEASHNER